jgi:RNA polymerase primary sigma factor
VAALRKSIIQGGRRARSGRGARTADRGAPRAKPARLAARERDAFDRYLTELQDLRLLDAREEVALAIEIERLVIAHWSALLSYAPARATVLSAVEAAPVVSPQLAAFARSQARSQALDVARASRTLRRLDRDCEALMAADAAVQAAFADTARASRYLVRVARARRAQERAKERFVAANLRLVIALARRYDGSLMPFADLVQEGNLGLMRAVERFDHRRGFRFSTYAAWWIRHALNRALSNQGRMVRVPVHALDDMARLRRTIATSHSATGVEPGQQELAAGMGMSVEKLALLQTHVGAGVPLSLDKGVGEDRTQTLHDLLPANDASDPDQEIDLGRWRAELCELLSGLSSIEATTLRLRFGLEGAEELTLREIGEKYNLSRERMRQIQEEALDKLRLAVRRKQRAHDENRAA